jgi:hypothetical protein
VIEIDKYTVGPESALQFLTANYGARLFEKDEKDFKWLLLQLDFDAVLAKLASLTIKLKITKAQQAPFRC